MSDVMRPIPLEQLLNWIIGEFNQKRSLFGLPAKRFFRSQGASVVPLLGEFLENPLGPAAGPHTQLAQNIISAYLTGGRFFELKTVQKLDQLRIDKPCIDAQDEGYNVEWSQELRLEQSYDEYVKAWFLLPVLDAAFGLSGGEERGFIFNMSVGYDLKGIQSERMNRFIEDLRDAARTETFNRYRKWLREWAQKNETSDWLKKIHGERAAEVRETLLQSLETISPRISGSVTVSTMHGCPPEEIEAICRYLMQEKHLHTYVKLNPTLLGFDTVRKMLDDLGYGYAELDAAAFERDLQFADAVPMLRRLREVARERGLQFGVKLSNTLGMRNALKRLPGDEMYMSGRSLFPLTINLAYALAAHFNGQLAISYSGGASMHNVEEILQTGIGPVTMVTELLKPGGYLRLLQMVQKVETTDWARWLARPAIDLQRLKALAESALSDPYYRKDTRQVESIKIDKNLPQFDCYVSPCHEACPIHQDIAEYIRLVEEGRYLDAFKVIVETNPLPHILGYICDHQCMDHCTRWDYESPVYIREMKKVAAENAWKAFTQKEIDRLKPPVTNGIRVAIIGAGPAGLSAAYFLARAGFEVTVLEKEAQAGGTVQNVIPDFRLPQYAIDRDVELVRRLGVEFRFNVPGDFSLDLLKKQGFKYIFLGIGAGKSRKLSLEKGSDKVIDALDFLRAFRQKKAPKLGRRVAVIGGGNSAMDAARAALRLEDTEEVVIVYRRTQAFMPADREEFDEAMMEGVQFRELLLPVAFTSGKLTCQKMQLAEQDTDGRRAVRPVKGALESIKIDAVIAAIGEEVDAGFLKANGIRVQNGKVWADAQTNETSVPDVFVGGDALRGPSTVVESVADGKKAALAIIAREERLLPVFARPDAFIERPKHSQDIRLKKGMILPFEAKEFTKEAYRCLGCNLICDKCVEVCPNRANVAIPVAGSDGNFHDLAQIVHIDGMCNECGNCATFCPYQGAPYKDKITVFWNEEDFENSENEGFFLLARKELLTFKTRLGGKTGFVHVNSAGDVVKADWPHDEPHFKQMRVVLKEIIKNHEYLLNMCV